MLIPAVGTAVCCLAPIGARSATPSVPVFQPEPISAFTAALQRAHQRTVDSVHQNEAAYHAFKFLDPQMVIVGVARAVRVDSNGRLHLVQAHGEPMGGHPNLTHQEYSHVLLPIGVQPPGH